MEDWFPLLNINNSEWDPNSDDGPILMHHGLFELKTPEEEEEEEEEEERKRKRKEGKTFDFNNPYYDVKSGSREKPPDEPLNVLAFPYAKMYKVDGSSTDLEDVVCLQKFRQTKVLVLGSCNGLLGLYRDPGDFFLINPSTGKENLVQVPAEECELYYNGSTACGRGLCHDSDNGEYKAVIFQTNSLSFHVLNFKNKSWRKCKVQYQLPQFYGLDTRTGTIVNGVPYWLCGEDDMVIYFDFKAEELRVVPDLPNEGKFGALGCLDGKLCLSSVSHSRLEFWNLETTSDGVSSWSLWHASTVRACQLSILSWMSRHDDEVLVSFPVSMFVYNLREQSL